MLKLFFFRAGSTTWNSVNLVRVKSYFLAVIETDKLTNNRLWKCTNISLNMCWVSMYWYNLRSYKGCYPQGLIVQVLICASFSPSVQPADTQCRHLTVFPTPQDTLQSDHFPWNREKCIISTNTKITEYFTIYVF